MTIRRFRYGRSLISIQHERTVREVRDPSRAHSVLNAAVEQLGPEYLKELIDEMEGRFAQPSSGEEAARLVAKRLLDGTLLVVRHDLLPRILDAPTSTSLLDLVAEEPGGVEPLRPKGQPPTTDPPPARTAAESTFFAVRFMGESGESFAGTRIKVELPNGSTRDAVLDQYSAWRDDKVETPGGVTVGLPDGLTVSRDASEPRGGPAKDSDARLGPNADRFSGATGVEHTVVVDRPGTACIRMSGMLFPLNKTFLLPEAMEGIRLLAHMYQKLAGADVLAVGHTDTTGSASRNRSLSLQRAQAVIEFATDDVDGWYAYYNKSTDSSRRWGKEEDLAMLAALPDRDAPYYGEHHEEHTFKAAVSRFQVAAGLSPTGETSEATRKALIVEYMAMDGTTLPDGVSATAHGCGEHFPAVRTDDGVEELENRRVEVFLFPNGVAPSSPGSTSASGSPAYPAWNRSVVEERTFVPSKSGLGSLALVTDIDEQFQALAGVAYCVRATDGSGVVRVLIKPPSGRLCAAAPT